VISASLAIAVGAVVLEQRAAVIAGDLETA